MFDRTDSPWVLTHVSSQWREVCISIPSLWSKVAINYSENQNPSSAYPLSVINAHIRRSHKLKIHFLGCGTVDPHPQIETFQLLLHHAPRWEEFCVEITPALVPLLAQLQDRLPSLLRLWINWEGPESQTGVQSVECFQTAPSLVDFGVFNEHAFVPFSFPIAQLTRYEFDGPWGMHSGVLRLASSLVEARILINFDEAPWPDPHEPIDLIHLRRLYVSNFRVLNYLRAPALDELAIWVSEDEPVEIPQLLAFIERSARSESLRNLCLKGSPDKETGVTILQKLPCITEFSLILRDSLEARTRIHALMLALTVSPGNAVVSPQLHALFLGCSDEGYVEYDVYLAMLKSRWTEQGCALQRAALATEEGPGPDPATLLGLMALRRDGLDILLVEGTAARYEMYAWSHAAPWN
ncbi:hypothetical protein C8R47DRAFT_1164358 [Mycena vitilis]|nr:hypothetical protein C8R47DRAFT_1164358 [Mycena vitilis]